MAKKYDMDAGSKLFEGVAKQSENKAKVSAVVFIPDEKLLDNPENNEDVSYTADIEDSIAKFGFTDPIEVTTFGQPDGYYMILSGHRRRMAGRKKGMTDFPCLVKGEGFVDELDIQMYRLTANRHRDSGKEAFDPMMQVNRCIDLNKVFRQMKERGRFDGNIAEAIAVGEGLSVSQVNRNLSLERVIPEIIDMIRKRQTKPNNVTRLASRPAEVQEGVYNIMREAYEAGQELTRDNVTAFTDGYEKGFRTWEACLAQPDQTRDSGLPLNGFIDTTDSVAPSAEPSGNRNNEVRRENDPIAAEYDAIEADKTAFEEAQREEITHGAQEDEPTGEVTEPELSEREQELKNGKAVMRAIKSLNTALEETYAFDSAEDAVRAIDNLGSTASAIMEEIFRIANAYSIGENGKRVLEVCGDDSVTYMGYIK